MRPYVGARACVSLSLPRNRKSYISSSVIIKYLLLQSIPLSVIEPQCCQHGGWCFQYFIETSYDKSDLRIAVCGNTIIVSGGNVNLPLLHCTFSIKVVLLLQFLTIDLFHNIIF